MGPIFVGLWLGRYFRGQKIIDTILVDKNHTLGDIVSYRELITCQKFTHFEHIRNDSGYTYEQMIFIDDEKHNLDDVNVPCDSNI